MKTRVHTGENRCEWVWMGADGCVGAQGHGGTHKKGKQRHKWCVGHALIPIWSGKFPRTSCFVKNQKNMHGALRMGVHGLGWV